MDGEPRIDLTGLKFKRFTVLAFAGRQPDRKMGWLCRCDCGEERILRSGSLRAKNNHYSCGCYGRDKPGHHGMRKSREYAAWSGMKRRCEKKGTRDYEYYGARGIRVCDRWQSFSAFLEDMGLRPSPQHSLDRIDNNGNYEPGNVRWASRSEQMRNRRTARILQFGDERVSMAEAAERANIPYSTLRDRIRSGADDASALSAPRYGRLERKAHGDQAKGVR